MSPKKTMKMKKTRMRPAVALMVLVLLISVYFLLTREEGMAADIPLDPIPEETDPIRIQQTVPEKEPLNIVLREGLRIREIGDYTGIFMEDGTDEVVTGVMMMVVENTSAEAIQYAEITMDVKGETASFKVTALPAGEAAVLLEQGRMPYSKKVDYEKAEVKCPLIVHYEAPLSLQEEKLKIQCLDAAMNITNISGEDITDTIVLCYKGWQDGLYYGGIAYRIKLEGGLKAGELRQIMAQHYMDPGSKLVFVEFAG